MRVLIGHPILLALRTALPRRRQHPPLRALSSLNMRFDPQQVAEDVHALAKSPLPIAPLVAEALTVIHQALDTHGYVYRPLCACYRHSSA